MKKGFTLIELLVVIAIIGILSSVVLASLNVARDKGSDAAITSNINNIRSQAALYYTDNSNYGTNVTDESNCAAVDNIFADPTIREQVAAADAANGPGTVTCNVAADGLAYAVSAELKVATSTYYCIDNIGSAKTSATDLGVATVCP